MFSICSALSQGTFATPGMGGLGPGGIGTNICSIHIPIYGFVCFWIISYWFFELFTKPLKNIWNVLFQLFRPPWQGTFVTPWMGMGWGGGNWDQYLFHPSPNIWFLFWGKMIYECFLTSLVQKRTGIIKIVFFQFVRPPGRELLPHRGWGRGWGGGGTNRGQYLYHHPIE